MSTVYFGTGIKSYKWGLTAALPFEYFGFLCESFLLAREIGADKVLQEITDTYESDNTVTCTDDFNMAARQVTIINNLANFLNVEDRLKIKKASDFRRDPKFLESLDEVTKLQSQSDVSENREYFLLQSAGLDFFRKTQDVVAKIGWLVDTKKPGRGMDEFTFNSFYQDITGDRDFRFEYVNATRLPNGNRVSPYFTNQDEINNGRLIFSENSFQGLDLDDTKAARRYVENIEGIIKKFENLLQSETFKYPTQWDYEADLKTKLSNLYDNLIRPSCRISNLQYGELNVA